MRSFDVTKSFFPRTGISLFVRLAAGLSLCVGGLVLIGWAFDIPSIKSITPLYTSMKANAALNFILAGVSLWLLTSLRPSKAKVMLARLCAALISLSGLLILSQYLFSVDLGIDQLLFSVTDHYTDVISQGRLTPMGCINFLLLGGALFCASFPRTLKASQWLVAPVGLIGLLNFISYLYGADELIMMGYHHTLMSIHASVLFMVMSLAVFFMHPSEGLAQIVTGNSLGGWVLRRFSLVILISPLLIGWLQIQGEGSGYFNSAFRIAVMVTAIIPVLAVFLWKTAAQLNQMNDDRQRAKQLMTETQESYRNQFADNSVVMLMIDFNDGSIVDANKAALNFYGYTREQLLAMRITDINVSHPETEVRRILKTVKEGVGGRFEFQHRLANGAMRHVDVSTSRVLFGDRMVLHSIVHDITDRKEAEAALRKSEEKYRLLTENAYAAVASHEMLFDKDGCAEDYTFLSVNTAFETQTGLRAADVLGRRVSEVLPGVEKTDFIDIYGRVVQTGVPCSFERYSLPLDRYYYINAYSLGNNQFATVFSDITARKKAEEALRERESFLNLMLETTPNPVFTKDCDGRYVLVNKAFATLFWRSKEDIIGKTVFDLSAEEFANEEHAKDQKLLAKPGVDAYYAQFKDHLGVNHEVIFQKATMTDKHGDVVGIIGSILDVTDFNQMESELHKITRLLDKDAEKGGSLES